MPTMNMKHLRSFLAMVEERSSARAAERLGIPRQSVTQHVRSVEELACRCLLETAWPREPRQVGRIQLTEAGLAFFPKAVRAMRAHDALFEERPSEPDPRDVRLAILHGLLELALDATRHDLSNADRKSLHDLLLRVERSGGDVLPPGLHRGNGGASG